MRGCNSVVGMSESAGLLSLLCDVAYFLVPAYSEGRPVLRKTILNFIIIFEPLGLGAAGMKFLFQSIDVI